MRRTAVLSLLAGALVAFAWLRLEEPRQGGRLALLLGLALVPALLPRTRWRLAAFVPTLVLGAAVAFDDSPEDVVARARRGLRSFYDVALPLDPAASPDMHGLVLLAILVFSAAIALAVAERRAIAAALLLAAGAGWPATIVPGKAPLAQGALILAGALVLLGALASPRLPRIGRGTVAGAAVVGAALFASSLPAIGRDQIVDWETWDPYAKRNAAVGVQYVWDSDYRGIEFPDEPTTLLEIAARREATYWRATTLDLYRNGHWFENTIPVTAFSSRGGRVELTFESDLPAAAKEPGRWHEQQVRVRGLRDTHLVGASVPIAYSIAEDNVAYRGGGIAQLAGGVRRGLEYSVWSYSPSPRPRELARSPARYGAISGTYFEVDRDVYVPPFGSQGRHARVLKLLRTEPGLDRYRRLYAIARRVGGESTPYGAVVALETWFRTNPEFVYEERPPRWPAGVPPLVDFLVRTKQGYCQQYAGAMALMLRYLGIPARIGAGFTSGRYDREKGMWTVTDRNAHTWVEVWFRGFGWLPFDPTPGRGNLAGPYTASSLGFRGREALEALGRQAGLGLDGRRAIERLRLRLARERALDPPLGASSGSASDGSSADPTLFVLLLGALGAAGAIGAMKVVRRRLRYRGGPRRIAAACRLELAEFVRDQRVDVREAATLAELGAKVQAALGVDARRFVTVASAARFGPERLSRDAARNARRELAVLKRAIRSRLSTRRRLWGLVSLRSLR